MQINMEKVRAVAGFKVDSIVHNGYTLGVVTIPAEGFSKLVGLCLSNGKWIWVAKNFRK